MAVKTKKSYAEHIAQTKVMLDGLKGNAKAMEKRGIDESFITEVQQRHEKVMILNSEQEKLKADLKAKTETLSKEMAAMVKMYSQAKKLVKIQFPQEQWKEFGIADKQ